jgi:hypothetical protein
LLLEVLPQISHKGTAQRRRANYGVEQFTIVLS